MRKKCEAKYSESEQAALRELREGLDQLKGWQEEDKPLKKGSAEPEPSEEASEKGEQGSREESIMEDDSIDDTDVEVRSSAPISFHVATDTI